MSSYLTVCRATEEYNRSKNMHENTEEVLHGLQSAPSKLRSLSHRIVPCSTSDPRLAQLPCTVSTPRLDKVMTKPIFFDSSMHAGRERQKDARLVLRQGAMPKTGREELDTRENYESDSASGRESVVTESEDGASDEDVDASDSMSVDGEESLQDASDGSDDDHDNGPKYAQFVDEDELEDTDASEDVEDAQSSDEDDEEVQLDSVPLQQLSKARRAMRQPRQTNTTDPDTLRARRESAKEQLRANRLSYQPQHTSKEDKERARKELEKREYKNAPTIMSTRRPVSRARNVVPIEGPAKSRDPRFDSLSAGPVNLDLLSKSYKFLPDLYEKEIASLKSTYDKLKRMEKHHAGPHAKSEQAAQIRQEKQDVELALRRAESQRNERLRRENERSVNSEIKKENQRRVDSGLRPYFPKKAERTAKALHHKYEQLAQQGRSKSSSAALKKAMERKVRKNAQKDRKSLDTALGGGSRTDLSSTMDRTTTRPSHSRVSHKRGRRG
ncbi:rRNA biogenesis protein rrp36 [Malassezia yamatoensis]|uniref:rRNA biogenesis protein RRP36 n=1 Tax=Malassezia yamatoensis TaxID=253288 RepID=A0AAJ6CIM8_9BASI|nr:rRNA biogenesis protein rrp36 [Malassezia yamatoensis]